MGTERCQEDINFDNNQREGGSYVYTHSPPSTTATVPESFGNEVTDPHVSQSYVRRHSWAEGRDQKLIPGEEKHGRTRCSKDQLGTVLRVP